MTERDASTSRSRGFAFGPLPPVSGAYPVGDHDKLLKAVLLEDEKAALALAWEWLDANDIDVVSFREHRLLIALLARFGKALEGHPYYPRIAGLQRMLWTRTLMHLRDARPALAAIAESGVPILLIKGAARLADGGTGKSGRVSHDLDIVVHPEDAPRTFAILDEHGWTSSSGRSNARIAREIGAFRALNMYKGRFGDIDLHLYPFHPHQGAPDDDRRLWGEALTGDLDGIPVLLPTPEQRIALAIAHGGLDAHNHSDWLCDIAAIFRAGPVASDRLEEILAARGIEPAAAIALHYLADECSVAIDRAMLDRVMRRAAANPLHYYACFLQARPRDREGRFGAVLRGIVKYARLRASKRALPAMPEGAAMEIRAHSHLKATAARAQPVLSKSSDISKLNGRLTLRARIEIVPEQSRPFDFELLAGGAFIGHASWRSRLKLPTALSIECAFDKPDGADRLTLEARPRRSERVISTEAEARRYGAVPYRVLDWSVEAGPIPG